MAYAQRSLELAERLADQLDTPEALRDLSVSLNNLGRVHRARGDWQSALELVRRARAFAEQLHTELDDDEQLLATLTAKIADLETHVGTDTADPPISNS
jgi:hypothetical protein